MQKKRRPHDRMRTAGEIAVMLGNIQRVAPLGEGRFEIYSEEESLLTMAPLILLDEAVKIVSINCAYGTQDLYYILKYTSKTDQRLSEFGLPRLSWRSGDDVTGITVALRCLWQAERIRKFCKGFFSPTAGGRPYGVKWLIKW